MLDLVNDPIVDLQYKKKNYLIEYDQDVINNRCAIYFSSHGLCYPETKENFQKIIVEKDSYEWYSTRIPDCHKHIFVRDIRKQFYVDGISAVNNSLEKLAAFLREETKGYTITAVGSSAGGYAATAIGVLLRSEKIFCFSGKFSLKDDFAYPTKERLIFHENDLDFSKYYDLSNLLRSNNFSKIYYIYPIGAEEDLVQKRVIDGLPNILQFPFDDRHHGVCMFPFNLTCFMAKKSDQMIQLRNRFSKAISKYSFSIELIGYRKTIAGLIKYNRKRVLMKIKKKFNTVEE